MKCPACGVDLPVVLEVISAVPGEAVASTTPTTFADVWAHIWQHDSQSA